MAENVDNLISVYAYEDEWPSRIGKFIADLAGWYSSHPSLSHFSYDDIEGFLLDEFHSELANHELRIVSGDFGSTRGTENTVNIRNIVVGYRDLCRTLTIAAFERFAFKIAA